jgi:hypothetical protein
MRTRFKKYNPLKVLEPDTSMANREPMPNPKKFADAMTKALHSKWKYVGKRQS